MVKGDVWHEIHSRWKLGEKKKAIGRALDLDVRTVRRVLRQKSAKPYERKTGGVLLLDGFKDRLHERAASVGYCAQSLFEEIRALGYEGGYDTVRRFVSPMREEAFREATVRFETPPGR